MNGVATAVAQPASAPPAQVAKVTPAGASSLFCTFCTYGTALGGHSAPVHVLDTYTDVSFTVYRGLPALSCHDRPRHQARCVSN
jgi:hypothetical protein